MAQLFWLSGQTLVDGTGTPYALAKANFYVTGTTTRLATYTSAGLSVSNDNPVVADSDGRFPPIYLAAARYKVVLTDDNDVQIGDDLDPVDGVLSLIQSASAPSPTYAFLRYHNTSDGNVYRRNSTNSAWINEGPVDGLGNAATVTQQLAGTATDAFSTPDSVAGLWQRGADLASASTLSLPAAGGGVFNVTGTTGITGISSAQGGRCIKLRFAAALTLTHNGTSFILPGAANITTVAGDTAEFINDAAQDASGSNWRCFRYNRSSGSPLNLTDFTAVQSTMETGTSTTLFPTVAMLNFHNGVAKCWNAVTVSGGVPTMQTSLNMTSITDTAAGELTNTIATDFSSANWAYIPGVESTTTGAPGGTEANAVHGESGVAAGSVVSRCTQSTGNRVDPESWYFVGFGDQA